MVDLVACSPDMIEETVEVRFSIANELIGGVRGVISRGVLMRMRPKLRGKKKEKAKQELKRGGYLLFRKSRFVPQNQNHKRFMKKVLMDVESSESRSTRETRPGFTTIPFII